MEKIKNYNQIILAIAGTIGVVFLFFAVFLALEEMSRSFFGSRVDRNNQGILAIEETDELNKDSLRKQIISFNRIQVIDSANQIFLIPVTQANLAAAEKDKFLRLFAEFENYKKRTSKERIELFKTEGQEVLQAMLPVLDDFDRANNEIEKSEDEALKQGITLIHTKLKDVLKSKGLEKVEVNVGDAFDADIHEAITQIPAPSDDLKGKIIDIIEKGYKLGDKIIRYPKVVTGN